MRPASTFSNIQLSNSRGKNDVNMGRTVRKLIHFVKKYVIMNYYNLQYGKS